MKVLLAEEDPLQRQFVREYLEIDPQFEVHEAKGIFHLLAMCESRLPGVCIVLLDMEMTRVDGVDLILKIRRTCPSLPILGMTDRRTELYQDARLRNSGAGLIPRPFSAFLLLRSIKAVLRSTAAMTAIQKGIRGKELFPRFGREGQLNRSKLGYGQNPV